ncbi:MAG: hypothetical protein M1832_000717 [Thelocarpon impressellum]|nr:MAG: hypothetical protein M1832_000717 [Thelocarpon impressellum]
MGMPGQDFLRLDPDDGPWRKVTALLLDPSCSGSGIVDRGKVPSLRLPSTSPRSPQAKRKPERRKTKKQAAPSATTMSEQVPMHEEELGTSLADRLTSLATFQLKLLTHALRFPAARRITYSTCSIYAQENEHVVAKALSSPIAMDRGWRMLRREEQVAGARGWNARGDAHALIETEGGEQIAEACIRCNKDDGQGTMGFFVAAFVRDEGIPKGLQTPTEEHAGKGGEDVEEWQGFSSADEGRSAASKAKSKRQRIR